MTLEGRVQRLENAFILLAENQSEQVNLLRTHGELLRDHGRLLTEQGRLLTEQGRLLLDIVGRLERIEQAIRERGFNGTSQP